MGHSITYRIAVGPRAGQKVFTLQTVPAKARGKGITVPHWLAGFRLHAGLDIDVGPRYVSRPPLAVDSLALAASGQARTRQLRSN